jgi:hypothetical protein
MDVNRISMSQEMSTKYCTVQLLMSNLYNYSIYCTFILSDRRVA